MCVCARACLWARDTTLIVHVYVYTVCVCVCVCLCVCVEGYPRAPSNFVRFQDGLDDSEVHRRSPS